MSDTARQTGTPDEPIGSRHLFLFWEQEALRMNRKLVVARALVRRLCDLMMEFDTRAVDSLRSEINEVLQGGSPSAVSAAARDSAVSETPNQDITAVAIPTDQLLTPTVLDESDSDEMIAFARAGGA